MYKNLNQLSEAIDKNDYNELLDVNWADISQKCKKELFLARELSEEDVGKFSEYDDGHMFQVLSEWYTDTLNIENDLNN